MEAFYEEPPGSQEPSGKEGKRDGALQRAVKLVEKQEGLGLICRIHRLSGSTPSAMRVLERLFPSTNRNGLRPRILKTEAALLAPSPPALGSKRKHRHVK